LGSSGYWKASGLPDWRTCIGVTEKQPVLLSNSQNPFGRVKDLSGPNNSWVSSCGIGTALSAYFMRRMFLLLCYSTLKEVSLMATIGHAGSCVAFACTKKAGRNCSTIKNMAICWSPF
jgi:hypothetical protein